MTTPPYPQAPDFSAGPPPAAPMPATQPVAPTSMSNGLMSIMSGKQLADQERLAAQVTQAQPHIAGLAAHVRRAWEAAKRAKLLPEERMMRNLRARSGEYEADKLAAIRQQGGSELYMQLTATKCRGAAALVRDLIMGTGSDKPWTLEPTEVPDLPADLMERAKQEATDAVMPLYMQGPPPDQNTVIEVASAIKQRYLNDMKDKAKEAVALMESKMEDQLQEGGFLRALSAFIDDLSVYPSAILKGPVIRKKHRLQYVGGQGPSSVQVTEQLVKEWERVDPTRFYPAPHAASVSEGYMIEHHSLTVESLSELKGVDGYDDNSISAVIQDYGNGGLHEWLRIDAQMAAHQEKLTTFNDGPEALIDALQFWGAVNGKMLLDWGMAKDQITDETKMYWVEAWLIGTYVIKAVLNPHPLGEKPYYVTSYEKIPGRFWGNSPADLITDCQAMCNAAARALANNMGVSSGPQVWVDVSRLPPGEDITQMYPWKIWQVDRDASQGSAAPMGFFQPEGFSQELMQVYERFAVLADEYSGIPRYMTGAEGTPGAGRTASGLSMMITNAGKTIKQVIASIDEDLFTPMLTQLYYHNLQYGDDPSLIGDVNIVARGAMSLQVKDSAAMNRNQFLQATANPIDMQIVGLPGRAAVLREQTKMLGINPDDVIPPVAELQRKQKVMEFQQQQQAQMQQAMMQQQLANGGQPGGPQGSAPPKKVGGGAQLMDGSPVTNSFPNQ